MREVEPDNQWFDEKLELTEPVEIEANFIKNTGPSDVELITITLLSRLYDVQFALLNAVDEETASRIFEAHEKGENFNPPMYIPDLKVEE